jgi:hypothetical protein
MEWFYPGRMILLRWRFGAKSMARALTLKDYARTMYVCDLND